MHVAIKTKQQQTDGWATRAPFPVKAGIFNTRTPPNSMFNGMVITANSIRFRGQSWITLSYTDIRPEKLGNIMYVRVRFGQIIVSSIRRPRMWNKFPFNISRANLSTFILHEDIPEMPQKGSTHKTLCMIIYNDILNAYAEIRKLHWKIRYLQMKYTFTFVLFDLNFALIDTSGILSISRVFEMFSWTFKMFFRVRTHLLLCITDSFLRSLSQTNLDH